MAGMASRETATGGEAARKGAEALELHLQGVKLEDIAQRVGYANRSGAYKAVQRGLRLRDADLDGLAEHGRARAYERYTLLFAKACKLALDGNTKAMGHAIRLADRLAGIEGVAPPEQIVRVTVQNEVDREIAALEEALMKRAREGTTEELLAEMPADARRG